MAGKKIMDDQRAEGASAASGVDVRRAESAHKHVRALNSQFASWVQSQLQNHPDELWEDGVLDYLSHASNIMEKFSDVVAWLRENSAKQETILHAHGSDLSCQKNLLHSTENVKPKSELQTRRESVQVDASCSAPSRWNSATFSSSQNTLLQGSQSFVQTKEDTADSDEENDLVRPSSPSVQKAEEKGIVIAHEAKCKVYVKPENPAENGWKDLGMGKLSIKCKEGAAKASKESKPAIVVRNDVGKILLNALIYPGIKINIQKNTIASVFHTSSAGVANEDNSNSVAAVARTYLLRLKTKEEAEKLAAIIEEYAPAP